VNNRELVDLTRTQSNQSLSTNTPSTLPELPNLYVQRNKQVCHSKLRNLFSLKNFSGFILRSFRDPGDSIVSNRSSGRNLKLKVNKDDYVRQRLLKGDHANIEVCKVKDMFIIMNTCNLALPYLTGKRHRYSWKRCFCYK